LDGIIGAIKSDYAGDIAAAFVYGATAAGVAREGCELEIYVIPKTERGYGFGGCFVIEGVGQAIFCMPWERAEKYAAALDMETSNIACSRLVYYASDEDKLRFEGLSAQALETQQSGGINEKSVLAARKKLEFAQQLYGEMMLKNKMVRAFAVLCTICDAIIQFNPISPRFGNKHILDEEMLDEMDKFANKPDGLVDSYKRVIYAQSPEDTMAACADLINLIDKYILEFEHKYFRVAPAEYLPDWYEMCLTLWDRIYAACAENRPIEAFCAANHLQVWFEIISNNQDADIPGLHLADKFNAADLPGFAELAKEAQEAFLGWLGKNGININYSSGCE